MGADKGRMDWGGATAIERLAALAQELGLQTVLTAGADHGLPFVLDAEPGAGPCGGILAAADRLRAEGCRRALVLAVDAPTVTAQDLRPLLAAARPGAAYEGLPLPMAIELDAIPPAAQAGWPLRRLVLEAGLRMLPCTDAAHLRLRGANTPEERRRLLSQLRSGKSSVRRRVGLTRGGPCAGSPRPPRA